MFTLSPKYWISHSKAFEEIGITDGKHLMYQAGGSPGIISNNIGLVDLYNQSPHKFLSREQDVMLTHQDHLPAMRQGHDL